MYYMNRDGFTFIAMGFTGSKADTFKLKYIEAFNTMTKLGRDPAVGSSVMITAITDTGGFFIFLGLATLFLL